MRWISEKHNWHRWFAWYPTFIINRATGHEMTIWWEHIARKKIMGNYFPYYIYNPDPDYKGEHND
jgi:hypothetical protein